MENLEVICLGHLANLNNRCKKCVSDEKNINCESYHPMQVYQIVEVREQTTEERKQKYL